MRAGSLIPLDLMLDPREGPRDPEAARAEATARILEHRQPEPPRLPSAGPLAVPARDPWAERLDARESRMQRAEALARLDADAATMTGDTRAANDRARDILSIPRAPVDDSYPLDEVRVPGARLPSPAFDAEEPEVYGLPVSHPWQPLEVQEGARVARERQRAAGQQRSEDAPRPVVAEAGPQHVRQQRAHRRRGPSPLTSARGRQLLAREITRDIFERFVGALEAL